MEAPIIRRAVLSDIPYYYEIVLKNGNDGNDATDFFCNPYLLGHYYAAPYLLFKDGICFTVEHEYKPQGYILSVPDTKEFYRWMEEEWLPPLRKRFPGPFPPEIIRSENERKVLTYIHECHFPVNAGDWYWIKDYPAHLHIDLLPGLQRKGLGSTLMHLLFDELSKISVSGIFLGVGIPNTNAIAFYKQLGFMQIDQKQDEYIMTKSLKTQPQPGAEIKISSHK